MKAALAKRLPKFKSFAIAIFILKAYCKNNFKGKGQKCENIKIRMNQVHDVKNKCPETSMDIFQKYLKYLISNLILLQSTLQRLLYDFSEHVS